MPTPWLRALTALFPKGIVVSDAETLKVHSGDAWFASALPQAVVFPRKAEDVATVLRFANKRKIPVTGARRGSWLCRRMRPEEARHRRLVCPDESHS